MRSILVIAVICAGSSAVMAQDASPATPSDDVTHVAGADPASTESWFGLDTRTRNIIVGGIVAVLVITGLALGFSDRAVFYRNGGEAVVLIALPVLAVVMLLLGMTVLQENDSLVKWSMAGLLGATVLVGYVTAFISNRNPLVAGCVGTAKILIVFLFVAFLVKLFFPGGKTKAARTEDRVSGAVGSGVFGMMIWRLVNGDRVAARSQASAG